LEKEDQAVMAWVRSPSDKFGVRKPGSSWTQQTHDRGKAALFGVRLRRGHDSGGNPAHRPTTHGAEL